MVGGRLAIGVGGLSGAGGNGRCAATGGGIGVSVVLVGWRLSVRWRAAMWCSGGGPSRLVNVLEGLGW